MRVLVALLLRLAPLLRRRPLPRGVAVRRRPRGDVDVGLGGLAAGGCGGCVHLVGPLPVVAVGTPDEIQTRSGAASLEDAFVATVGSAEGLQS